tara:strand:+ start:2538 stop:2852 length:315 start_codon:yes stop_codon:yes gene_type:complete
MPSKYDSKSGSPKKSRVQKYRGGGAANPRAMKEQQRAMLQRSFVPQGLTPAAPRPRPTPPSNAPGMGGGMGFGMKGGSSVPSYNQVIEKKGGGKINHNPSSVNP